MKEHACDKPWSKGFLMGLSRMVVSEASVQIKSRVTQIPTPPLSGHCCWSMVLFPAGGEGGGMEICFLSHLSKERALFKTEDAWLSSTGGIDLKVAQYLMDFYSPRGRTER